MRNLIEIKENLCHALRAKTSFSEVELISSILMSVIIETYSGDMLYIPSQKTSRFHKKIRAKFNGHNHCELAREYDCSVRTIYKILENKKPEQTQLI